MKKMIVLTSLWSFLFIFSFSMFGCSEDDDEFIVVPTSLLHNWRREAKRFTTLAIAEYNSNTAFPKGHTAALVEKDGNFITGKGPGAAMAFSFAIAEKYVGAEKVTELKQGMMIAE